MDEAEAQVFNIQYSGSAYLPTDNSGGRAALAINRDRECYVCVVVTRSSRGRRYLLRLLVHGASMVRGLKLVSAATQIMNDDPRRMWVYGACHRHRSVDRLGL